MRTDKKTARARLTVVVLLLSAANLSASGSAGIYGIVEKVVFEPNEQAPERIQVWGAFAFNDSRQQAISEVKRGYLYFRLPAGNAGTAKTDWKDLKSVAGTGQAVAFGAWGYIGRFEELQSDARSSRSLPYFLAREPGNPITDLRVRRESEPLDDPAAYEVNIGIVKLSENGNNADIVKRLKESLRR